MKQTIPIIQIVQNVLIVIIYIIIHILINIICVYNVQKKFNIIIYHYYIILYNIMYYILFIIISFLLFSLISSNLHIIRISLYLSIFLLLKWIFNHNNCTFGYMECKFRNIVTNKSHLFSACLIIIIIVQFKKNYYFIA